MRDFDGHDGLARLAHIGCGFAHVIPLGILLGDGGTTLARALGHIINECAGDALQIKTFIRVERTVFGRHNRVADVVRQPLARDD